MNKILESLKSKKVRYGSFSTLMIVVVIAILVILNLVAERLNLSFDMTANKDYSISQDTKDALAEMSQDVTIYVLARTGEEGNVYSNYIGALTFKELIQAYADISKHISIVYKDPYLYPQFAEKYVQDGGALEDNSVIVEGPSRFRVLKRDDMFTTGYDQSYNMVVQSIDVEPSVTNAINYVVAEKTPAIYTFTSHNEAALPEGLTKQMNSANFEVKTFDVTAEDVPEDCEILFIGQPEHDWTEAAAERVKKYLQNDGRAFVAASGLTLDIKNMNGVLETFGVKLGKYMVIESDSRNYFNMPVYLLPEIKQADITQPLIDKKYPLLLIQSTGVDMAEIKKQSTKIEPLAATTKAAYGKMNAETAETIEKEPGDVDGPINLSVAVTDSFNTDAQHTTKLVVSASPSLLDSDVNGIVSGANYLFIINALNWLYDKTDLANSVYIPPKTPQSAQQLSMPAGQANFLALLTILFVLAILGVGAAVWLRRRYN